MKNIPNLGDIFLAEIRFPHFVCSSMMRCMANLCKFLFTSQGSKNLDASLPDYS